MALFLVLPMLLVVVAPPFDPPLPMLLVAVAGQMAAVLVVLVVDRELLAEVAEVVAGVASNAAELIML